MNCQPAVRLRLLLLFGFMVCIGFSCRRDEDSPESVDQVSKAEETFAGLATDRQKLIWQCAASNLGLTICYLYLKTV